MFEIMLPAFLISVVLIGIHSYLGMHILARGVIFVDISLAQLAACGAVVGVFLGVPFHSSGSYFISLFFTILGAFIFSISRGKRNKEIPQEAIIGIVYVVSAALSVLILDKLPSEAEHLKEMLVGNILFVTPSQIIKTTLLYSVIGILHYLFRKKFILISFEPQKAQKEFNVKLWDFIFYFLFGVVVTSSVELAGVFLVFTFLIIPSIMAILLANSLKTRIILSWGLGILIMSLGLCFSVWLDTPTGPTVIVFFGLVLLFTWFLKQIKS